MRHRTAPPKPMDDWSKRFPGWTLVTGASSGLGRCYARALAARGLDVVVVARRRERLEALAEELRAGGRQAHVIVADLATDAGIAATIEGVGDRPVSVLVNNAGAGSAGPMHMTEPEHLAQIVRLNCLAPTLLARHFIPPMIERRRGAHIILSSVVAYQPTAHYAVYGATKSFDLMLGEALWAELRHTGIETLVVSPGLTRTEFQSISGTASRMPMVAPEWVVERSLRALGKRPSFVPGWGYKIVAQLHRLLPRGLQASFGERLARRIIQPDVRERYLRERRSGG